LKKIINRINGFILLFILISFLFFTTSCSTPSARFVNISQVPTDKAVGSIYVGPFLDLRKEGNVDTRILGTRRGGYGIPFGRVYDERGADEFIREIIINSARALFIIADRKPDNIILIKKPERWIVEYDKELTVKRPILVGVINQLIVEAGFSRGTVVDIDLELLDPETGNSLWASKLTGKESGGMGYGIYVKRNQLKNWLAKTVQDQTLNVLKKPEFENLIKLDN